MALGILNRGRIEIPDFGEEPITFLHLSDIHFRDPHFGVSRTRAARKFFKALRAHLTGWKKKTPPLSAVFVTGDVSYRSRQEDFLWAYDFLRELLRVTGVVGERLYIVPGEHDVYLRFIQNTDDTLQLPDPESWNQLLEDERTGKGQRIAARFSDYQAFVHRLGVGLGARIPSAAADFFFTGLFAHGERKVAVLGLNSAWSCRCRLDMDRGRLCLGRYQVEDAFDTARRINEGKEPDVVICLMHHPAEWMKENDAAAIEALAGCCDLVLRGHQHKGEDSIAGGERTVPVLSVSSLFAEEPAPGFAFLAMDAQASKIYMWPYRWDRSGKAFEPAGSDKVSEGSFLQFDLPGEES